MPARYWPLPPKRWPRPGRTAARVVADEGEKVGCGDRAPAGLGALRELEHHGQGRCGAASSASDPGPQLDGADGGFDRVRCSEVDPVFGGEIVERQEFTGLVGDLLHRLWLLRAVGAIEVLDGLLCVVAVFGVVDLLQCFLRSGPGRLRQGIDHVAGLCEPSTFGAWPAENLRASPPQAHRAVTDHEPGAAVRAAGSHVAGRPRTRWTRAVLRRVR